LDLDCFGHLDDFELNVIAALESLRMHFGVGQKWISWHLVMMFAFSQNQNNFLTSLY